MPLLLFSFSPEVSAVFWGGFGKAKFFPEEFPAIIFSSRIFLAVFFRPRDTLSGTFPVNSQLDFEELRYCERKRVLCFGRVGDRSYTSFLIFRGLAL